MNTIETTAECDDEGQATVLAFRRERPLDPIAGDWQRHRRGQMLLIGSGLLTVQTRSGSWVVPGGQCFWLPPDQEHRLRVYGCTTGWTAFVAPEACGTLPRRPGAASLAPLLREMVSRACDWEETPAPGSPQARLEAVILDEIAGLPLGREHLPLPLHAGILKITQAIIADPAEGRSLEELAHAAGLSRRTATRRFVQETGLSFSAWRQRVRLLQAAEMLAAEMPVTNVALTLGYDSLSAFTAMFRRHYGTPPSRFMGGRDGMGATLAA